MVSDDFQICSPRKKKSSWNQSAFGPTANVKPNENSSRKYDVTITTGVWRHWQAYLLKSTELRVLLRMSTWLATLYLVDYHTYLMTKATRANNVRFCVFLQGLCKNMSWRLRIFGKLLCIHLSLCHNKKFLSSLVILQPIGLNINSRWSFTHWKFNLKSADSLTFTPF